MMKMDSKCLKDDDDDVDLETGMTTGEDNGSGVTHAKQLFNKIFNSLTSARQSIRGENATRLGNGFAVLSDIPLENGEPQQEKKHGEDENLGFVEKKTETKQPKKKKKSCKKPPKPPRPPRAVSLHAADQKLIREISELTMLKRARMERMKALMKMKNAKSTSSNGSFCALVITVLFCLVIILQGFCSRSHSNVTFEGSPESSVGTRGQMISVQYFKNAFTSNPNRPTSAASPRLSKVDR